MFNGEHALANPKHSLETCGDLKNLTPPHNLRSVTQNQLSNGTLSAPFELLYTVRHDKIVKYLPSQLCFVSKCINSDLNPIIMTCLCFFMHVNHYRSNGSCNSPDYGANYPLVKHNTHFDNHKPAVLPVH